MIIRKSSHLNTKKMTSNIKKISFLLLLSAISVLSCKKTDPTPAIPPNLTVVSKTTTSNGFSYKEYYQETATADNRKGIVILTHGDGGTSNDGILNAQCTALATEGYVAITSSYRPLDVPTNATYAAKIMQFKADMEGLITTTTNTYSVARNKVIIGGLSRGGNCTYALSLPAGNGITPFAGIKGVILECAGGDAYGGGAILFPVAFMANKIDPTVGIVDANDFKNALQNNNNPNVKTLSECLIIDGSGHCGSANLYQPFVVKKVKEWLP